jgi:hypothetical protein
MSREKSLSRGLTEAEFERALLLKKVIGDTTDAMINATSNKERSELFNADKNEMHELSTMYDKGLVFEYIDASFLYDEYNDYLHDR